MTKHYKDYFWKDAMPYGKGVVEHPENAEHSVKIVSDPYHKRITIEAYAKGQFVTILYDSALLDFRQMKKGDYHAWEKVITENSDEKMVALIKNQDDRIVFKETQFFKNGLSIECLLATPEGHPLSLHKLFYTAFGDPFNGVILYDRNKHPVLCKKYDIDEKTQEFGNLIEENWDFEKVDSIQ